MSDSPHDADRPSGSRTFAVRSPAFHDALADPRRLTVLSLLDRDEGPVALADLAREVAARERNVPVTEVSDEAAQRVRCDLYHCHAPKLADAGLVTFDAEARTVALGDDVPEAVPRLDRD